MVGLLSGYALTKFMISVDQLYGQIDQTTAFVTVMELTVWPVLWLSLTALSFRVLYYTIADK